MTKRSAEEMTNGDSATGETMMVRWPGGILIDVLQLVGARMRAHGVKDVEDGKRNGGLSSVSMGLYWML